ncbi:MAG: hypothetical protein K8823_1010 [Cenarchaeum symbiont of Oopsacas minuta]|nr:hypothetical protein [Cenarchaeum symbiont of Oopsacas minuta]
MSSDKDLERLKAKRLYEMKHNIAKKEYIAKESKKPHTPRQILVSRLGHRGIEVLEIAERQYPRQVPFIISKIAELLLSGKIDERIDGGELLALFRLVGINVHMNTKINVEKDGKFVSLAENLKADDK